MSNLDKQFYFLRTSKSLYYSTGSGANSTPKLYSKGSGTTVRNNKNVRMIQSGAASKAGLYELVPVTFIIGEPI